VLIFYPLFTKLEEWVKDLSTKIVLTGKSLAGKYLGTGPDIDYLPDGADIFLWEDVVPHRTF